MITMDVQGLNWIGNVYQKFEAMCLEVEEIMYQDTLKYVENQVETVGASFKRFYSDVMEDMVPPSKVDPMKLGDSDSLAGKYADCGKYRKPKTGIRQVSSRFAAEKVSDDSEVVTDMHETGGHTSSLHRRRKVNNLSPKSSGALCKRASSNSFPRQHAGLNSNSGLTKSLQKESLSQGERSGAPLEKNSSTTSLFDGIHNGAHRGLDTQMALSSTSASNETKSCQPSDSIEKKHVETEKAEELKPDVSADISMPGVSDTIEAAVENETEVRSSQDDKTERPNAADEWGTDTVASLVCSLENGDVQCGELADNAFGLDAGRLDDRNPDVEASYVAVTGQVVENTQKDDEVEFEECVVVDEEELLFVPSSEGKQKSCKKGIRKVLSSRKSSSRKQEYEQLATWYRENGVVSECTIENQNPSEEEVKKPLSHDNCESEWELL